MQQFFGKVRRLINPYFQSRLQKRGVLLPYLSLLVNRLIFLIKLLELKENQK